ncbi:3-hydroxyacyl-CoA dehydrogenase NAD-binding domain-containing protein [Novosphingobium mathurense]|uniref:3-hydroxyacyl-CoA dehydrogenase n=1 Tax=Novosphingobium mathurense TaxID=428990 RepID=A0A1U6HUW9_9SPHN|nr:3-hydroxyacyl-CoA dehydrogenase NAD-binding domain-containing protein [Novosphingobium mathurense]SLJ99555.1 3-hydroxyacyl-CoA dehydrogenase [Novosphingobium mathurense]
MKNFTITVDADGIALVSFDVPGRTMNTFTDSAVADLDLLVERIRADGAIKGAVLASGKANAFCAGADLGELGETAGGQAKGATLAAALPVTSRMSRALRALETVGKPVAAALEGLALGGGFEFALAAHRRVAARGVKVGLPEVTIGLLPGAGGTQRTTRLAGPRKALDFMLGGKPMDAETAQSIGLVDEVVEPGEAVEVAKAWIRNGGEGVQPWDVKGYRMEHGPYTPAGSGVFMLAAAQVQAKGMHNYPAQENIARCVYEGYGLPMDAALRVEARLFLATQQTPQARAMIRSLFVSKQANAKGAGRPEGVPPSKVTKAAVLGAGMMGAGIAFAQARAGIETVLIDTSQEAADKGRAYSEAIVEKAVSRGTMTREEADALIARILATTDYEAIAGADLVVEAVFEDRGLKADVTVRAEAVLASEAVFASNTSTLPITGLAQASKRPANFIGIHFFSPVDRMELVEIIVGKETSTETLAKAVDYCKQLKKVPIVVNDSRGFYTSRVFDSYLREGFEMLMEGIAPAIIDNVGRMTGMPRGPLELTDDVAIDLVDKVARQARVDMGLGEPSGGSDKMLIDLVAADRLGRKNAKGFYDYPKGEPKRLWSGLAEMFPVKVAKSDPELLEKLKRRFLYRQAVETARCLDEGVLTSARDADVGAILGWGFATWTGGPASLIDMVGVARFVEECDALAEELGDRFAPPALLRRMAEQGDSFYPAPKPLEAAA